MAKKKPANNDRGPILAQTERAIANIRDNLNRNATEANRALAEFNQATASLGKIENILDSLENCGPRQYNYFHNVIYYDDTHFQSDELDRKLRAVVKDHLEAI